MFINSKLSCQSNYTGNVNIYISDLNICLFVIIYVKIKGKISKNKLLNMNFKKLFMWAPYKCRSKICRAYCGSHFFLNQNIYCHIKIVLLRMLLQHLYWFIVTAETMLPKMCFDVAIDTCSYQLGPNIALVLLQPFFGLQQHEWSQQRHSFGLARSHLWRRFVLEITKFLNIFLPYFSIQSNQIEAISNHLLEPKGPNSSHFRLSRSTSQLLLISHFWLIVNCYIYT